MNKIKPVSCKYCKSKPTVVVIDGLYYTVCTGCNKYNIYEFCGLTRDKSVNNWNIANIPFAKTSENMSKGF